MQDQYNTNDTLVCRYDVVYQRRLAPGIQLPVGIARQRVLSTFMRWHFGYRNFEIKDGYIEFARLEYYTDAIHSARIVNPPFHIFRE